MKHAKQYRFQSLPLHFLRFHHSQGMTTLRWISLNVQNILVITLMQASELYLYLEWDLRGGGVASTDLPNNRSGDLGLPDTYDSMYNLIIVYNFAIQWWKFMGVTSGDIKIFFVKTSLIQNARRFIALENQKIPGGTCPRTLDVYRVIHARLCPPRPMITWFLRLCW